MNLSQLLQANPNPEPVFEFVAGEFQFSASQVDTFRDCPRKWAYRKIFRIIPQPHPSAELGSRVHTLREKWLRDGEMPEGESKEARLARAGLEQLPMPGTCDVELEFTLQTPHGIVLGYKDFFMPDQAVAGYYPPELLTNRAWPSVDGVPLVGDHKTTASEQWIKTPEILTGGDSQGALYAQAARVLRDFDTPHGVDLFWHYLIKKTRPKAIPVRVRMSNDQIDDTYGRVLETAEKMLSIFDTRDIKPEDIEPNPQACDKYGGCPYRDRCPLTNDQRMTALMRDIGEPSMSTLEEQLRHLAGSNGGGVQTPASATQLPTMNSLPAEPAGADSSGEGIPAGLVALMGQTAAQQPAHQPAVHQPAQPAALGGLPASLAAHTVVDPNAVAAQAGAPPAPSAVAPPALASTPTVPDAQQSVVPPDAPAPDLNAQPPQKKTRKPRQTKAKAYTPDRRELFALTILSGLASSPKEPQNGSYVLTAVQLADGLIEALDNKKSPE